MSNIIGIIVGVILVASGFVLLVAWWPLFIRALMAIVPFFLILLGAGILAYYISEIKSKAEMEEEKTKE